MRRPEVSRWTQLRRPKIEINSFKLARDAGDPCACGDGPGWTRNIFHSNPPSCICSCLPSAPGASERDESQAGTALVPVWVSNAIRCVCAYRWALSATMAMSSASRPPKCTVPEPDPSTLCTTRRLQVADQIKISPCLPAAPVMHRDPSVES